MGHFSDGYQPVQIRQARPEQPETDYQGANREPCCGDISREAEHKRGDNRLLFAAADGKKTIAIKSRSGVTRRSVTAIVLIQLFCRSVAIRTNTAKRGQCMLFLQGDIKRNYWQSRGVAYLFPAECFGVLGPAQIA